MSEVDGWITIGTKLSTKELESQYKRLTRELEQKQKEAEKLAEIKAKINFDSQEYEKQKQLIEETTNKLLEQAQDQKQIDFILGNEKIELEELNSKYSNQSEELENIDSKINENVQSQESLKQQIEETNAELRKTRDFSSIKSSIDKVGKSVQNVTKKVIRWGLAIFGIRSAYMLVRQAMSTLSSYNEQLKVNLEYIRFAIATALEPLIIKIVEWAYKLLSIVGSIIKLITGYDIFKNSGVDKFQKSLNKSASSAKEIKKQLAGFDEMNILSDNSDSSAGGGAGASGLPSMELSSDVKLPKWMYDLKAYGKDIISIILGIAGAIKLLELGLKPIQAIGIGIAIAGITYAIISLLDYLKDPTWENFGGIIIGIGLAVAGLGIAFLSLPVAIAGVAIAIVGIIIQHWEEIKGLFDKAVNWLTEKMNYVKEKYGFFAGLIVEGIRDIVKSIRDALDGIFTNAKNILDNIIKFFKDIFKGKWKEAWNDLVNIGKSSFNILISFIKGVIGTISGLFKTAFGIIGDVIGGIIKGTINAVLNFVESKINLAISMFNNVLSFVNKLPGVDIKKIGYVSLPRLAKGGIINQPSRGVPVGGAIAGERGQEGVIPLTDSQQMALLGEAIGKYITINATVINSMNGRVISREIQKVQNQSNFAMNR